MDAEPLGEDQCARPAGKRFNQRRRQRCGIEGADAGKLAALLLELAHIGGPQAEQYHG